MTKKNYTEEFRRDAVELYRDTDGATVAGIAADLGISHGSLTTWLRNAGIAIRRPAATAPGPDPGETPEQEAARLRAEVAHLRAEKTKLESERDILRSAAKYFGRRDELVNRFQFVADHSDTYPVKRLCQVIDIARSSYYAWINAGPVRAARAAADVELAEKIRAVHTVDNTYGRPRITAEINHGQPAGQRVNHKRIARIMRANNIEGLRLRRKHRTTIAEPADTASPDLLNRDFTATSPNTRYVGDITYLPCGDSEFLYLSTVIDCFSRRLVGWSIADHMRTELVENALSAAALTRGGLTGAVFHADHGSQYTSKGFAVLCAKLGVAQSMGAVGTSADNALAESFNATLKRETLQGATRWESPRAARLAVFRWITRYNTRRRHSYCDYLSPTDYETAHTSDSLQQAA
ncbi:IS3 family transposase [Rhodococcus qingshengii]|nr:IS3 family transposase [Rhodococcus qingshengii]MCD2130795.1 IS3 family transposase [Rhodococcus qingshengii]